MEKSYTRIRGGPFVVVHSWWSNVKHRQKLKLAKTLFVPLALVSFLCAFWKAPNRPQSLGPTATRIRRCFSRFVFFSIQGRHPRYHLRVVLRKDKEYSGSTRTGNTGTPLPRVRLRFPFRCFGRYLSDVRVKTRLSATVWDYFRRCRSSTASPEVHLRIRVQ